MKSTGMVRRIDELGRIVIPKEIRKSLTIRDGESLEIFIEDEKIILRKISQVIDINNYIKKIIDAIVDTAEINVIVTDRNKINLVTESTQDILDKTISNSLYNYINNRETFNNKEKEKFFITKDDFIEGFVYLTPLIVDGDAIGSIILYTVQAYDEKLALLGKIIAKFVEVKLDIS